MEYGFEGWIALRDRVQGDDPQILADGQHVPAAHLHEWQTAVDCLADAIDVPVALIMRINQDDIEVFVTSDTAGNPYMTGDRERLVGSGLYCEEVIKSRGLLNVPNALVDEGWRSNPDVKLNMIAYLGLPLMTHGGGIFGTICVLDSQQNDFSGKQVKLLSSFRRLIESQLELVRINRFLENRTEQLNGALLELRSLRGLIRICCSCKKVSTDSGWQALESVLAKRGGMQFTHGYCEACAEVAENEISEYLEEKEENT